MKFDGRKASRVRMDNRQPVNLMGSDGTWRRSCVLLDISNTGAKIEVEGSLDVLSAKEFFMLLSSTGLAYRRCELVWSTEPRLASTLSKQMARRPKRQRATEARTSQPERAVLSK
ncbi:hypothetical protein ABIA99_007422 [Bradyrhizobium sp. LB12.1]|uniref:PilZ domain-containing protein n=1 Tax=Bradyrhizobium sp. LB12.1 TaxID=3156327 RepID=UPI003395680F